MLNPVFETLPSMALATKTRANLCTHTRESRTNASGHVFCRVQRGWRASDVRPPGGRDARPRRAVRRAAGRSRRRRVHGLSSLRSPQVQMILVHETTELAMQKFKWFENRTDQFNRTQFLLKHLRMRQLVPRQACVYATIDRETQARNLWSPRKLSDLIVILINKSTVVPGTLMGALWFLQTFTVLTISSLQHPVWGEHHAAPERDVSHVGPRAGHHQGNGHQGARDAERRDASRCQTDLHLPPEPAGHCALQEKLHQKVKNLTFSLCFALVLCELKLQGFTGAELMQTEQDTCRHVDLIAQMFSWGICALSKQKLSSLYLAWVSSLQMIMASDRKKCRHFTVEAWTWHWLGRTSTIRMNFTSPWSPSTELDTGFPTVSVLSHK